MKSTEKKAKRVGDIVYAQGRPWKIEEYEKFRKYQTAFNKTRYKMYGFRLLKDDEEDQRLIGWLNDRENLNVYIRELIEKDFRKHKK